MHHTTLVELLDNCRATTYLYQSLQIYTKQLMVGGGNRPFGLLIQLTDQKVCYHTHLLRSSELVLEMLVPSKDLKKIRHLAS